MLDYSKAQTEAMPWDNILLGAKPASLSVQKTLQQNVGDEFWKYADAGDPKDQETFLEFQRRVSVVKQKIDGMNIKLVPVGDIKYEFEALVEYVGAICSPRQTSVQFVRSVSPGNVRYLPSKTVNLGSGDERGYFADGIIDILKREKKHDNDILFAVTKSPVFVTEGVWTEAHFSEEYIGIITLHGCSPYNLLQDAFRLVSRCVYTDFFNMKPCYLYKCPMNAKSMRPDSAFHLCPLCLRRLSVMASGSGPSYDFLARYSRLATVYNKYCPEQVQWIKERVMSITGQYLSTESGCAVKPVETTCARTPSAHHVHESVEGRSDSYLRDGSIDRSKLACLKKRMQTKEKGRHAK